MAARSITVRILSRLATSLVVAWASVTATFVALHALPGRIEDILAGDVDFPGLREAIAAEWGLNRSLPTQYTDFLLRIAQGDFGTSYVLRRPVIEVVGSQLRPTVELALAGGCWPSCWRPGSPSRRPDGGASPAASPRASNSSPPPHRCSGSASFC
ncbi:hypothetical protein R1A27_31295 (plasmid) [Methylobacterium sp. NMS12]